MDHASGDLHPLAKYDTRSSGWVTAVVLMLGIAVIMGIP
jgi:hypothetical protein